MGWFIPKDEIYKEITNEGTIPFGLFNVWHFLIKWIIPVLIGIVSVTGIIAVEETGLMIFGLVTIVIMAIFSKKMR